jgi:DNA-binding transcriptional LysR family regulator
VAASRLPHPLAAFHRDHPQVSVELQTAPSRELVARVQARTLDAAIVGDEVDDERFARVPLYTEELVLVGPGGRPLGREPSRLSGCTLLVFHGNGCTYRRRMEQWLQSRRAVPGRVLEFASYHAILASAAAGVGISLVPRSVLEIYPQRAALSVARMPSQLARVRTALVMQRGRHVPALTQLANCLREDARRAARGK